MQITIRDRQLKKLTAINNDIPEMLSFQDETLHLYKENSTATFDFSIPKYYFGKIHKDVDFINDDIYISLIDDGRPYYFYVHTLVQDDFRFILTCNDANLEYTMEQANPFINTEAHNINWYLKQMGLLDFAGVYVGLNEISDITRTLSFDNQQTKLERLSSLINQFGGEFELVTEVDKNGKYKGIRLDIYHEADDTHHGVGKIRGDVTLKYGKEVTGVQVTSVKEGFFNAGIFTGENGLNISDVEKTVKDEDGNVLFYTHAGSQMVYAPQSRDKYPSNVLSSDRWTRRDFSTNYTNKNELVNYTFKTIEQLSKPQITFLVSAMSGMLNGIKDLSIGDTVFIFDKNFKNGLLLKARVSEIIKCFTQPNNSAYVFTNYEVIKNNISSTLRLRIDEILESKIPYDLRILTNNGLQFKNSNGTSTISPELWKNNKKLNATFRFKNRDVVLGSGLQFTVDPKQFIDILNLTIEAYIGNEFIASKQLTFSNVNDGADGVGINSRSVTYGISTSATVQPTNWTEAMPVAKQGEYLWKRTITDYTDPSKPDTIELTYSYQGKNGSAGTSVSVTKIEYQVGTSGTTAPTGTWSAGLPVVPDGQFLWMKVTFSDGNIATMPGKQGAVGPKGDKGDTYYPHTAWANSEDGKVDFSTTDSKGRRYKGDYSDTNVAGSTDPTKYKWVDMVGSVEVGGVNLLAISKVVNGYIAAANGTVNPSYYPDGVIDQFIDVPDDATLIYQAWNPKRINDTTKSGKIAYYDAGGAYLGTYFFIPQYNGTPYQKAIIKLPSNVKKIKINVVLNDDIKIKIEFGNIPTAYTQAPEDVDAKIDTKADSELTQYQLNLLLETQNLMTAEMRTKATAEEVDSLIASYNKYVSDESVNKANVEAELIANAERIEAFRKDYDDKMLQLDFVSNYMRATDLGLEVSASDGSSSLLIQKDRISMLSAGKEVMYISQGLIHIDNGVFTKTLQIGNFRESQLDGDPTTNVTIYVG